MITESISFIKYCIREPVISHFFPKPKFIKLVPIISGSILTTDPNNLDHAAPFGMIPLLLQHF